MKSFAALFAFLNDGKRRRNVLALVKLVTVFILGVLAFTILFKIIMAYEGRQYSWVSGFYWVMVTMSTLGYGDISFTSDVGRFFSVVVLVSGSIFMLALLPFMFINFFYVPWMEAQDAARAPRELPAKTQGHVVLTGLGIVEKALIRMLQRAKIPYVVLCNELTRALQLHDEGYPVMLGELDDRRTYELARVNQASLVVTALSDTANTNIVFTVREISPSVSIVSTASFPASVDILELAGCSQVLQLGEMLGQALARRVLGLDARSHIVGSFGDLMIAEAAVAGTPLVGRQLKEIKLNEHSRVNVVGVWDRGKFSLAGPETEIENSSILLLSGTQSDLDEYDSLFCVYGSSKTSIIIIGGGRVGRACAKWLEERGIEYRLIEKNPARIRNRETYVQGDAAELEVLERAGIRTCSTVVITSHDDDINVYLSIYCRKLRPDVQILVRSNQDRNVSTIHRAGADFVLSYATMGSSNVYNLLRRGHLLMVAEGLDAFRIQVPESLVGKTLAESQFRQVTGCNVIGIEENGRCDGIPDPLRPLPANASLIVVADAEGEDRFYAAVEKFRSG